jgi:hypothetical protein
MSLKDQLEKLKEAYVAAGLDNAKQLQPPVPPRLLRQMEKQMGQKLPPELRELYLIHGGQRYVPPGATGVFGPYRFFPVTIMVRDYLKFKERLSKEPAPSKFPPKSGQKGSFHTSLIPFAGWNTSDLCIDASGRVWEFEPDRGLSATIRFPSIAGLIKHLLNKVKAGEKPKL